jgi:superfamily II DNA helicase RecQ
MEAAITAQKLRVLFVAPEAIAPLRSFLERLVKAKLLDTVVFDEVHCVSIWARTTVPHHRQTVCLG